MLYEMMSRVIIKHHEAHGADPSVALDILHLDEALCPRVGAEHEISFEFDFDAQEAHRSLASMELPAQGEKHGRPQKFKVRHPGGVGEIL